MKLILVRHGHDLPDANGDSSLSVQGRAALKKTAQALHDLGVVSIDMALTSPARRARQSLDTLAQVMSFHDTQVVDELVEGASADHLENVVRQYPFHSSTTLLVVGHEPQLSNAVLRWGDLPENDPADGTRPAWVLKRGDGMIVRPVQDGQRMIIHTFPTALNGRDMMMPRHEPMRRAGVF